MTSPEQWEVSHQDQSYGAHEIMELEFTCYQHNTFKAAQMDTVDGAQSGK